MRNVLHIRSSFDSGGTESLLLHLYNYKQNYFTIHLALIKNGKLIENLINKNNHYYKLFRKHFIDLSVLIKLYKIIKKNSISIIHTHQEIELLYAIVLKILKPDIKIFHSIHLLNYKKDYMFYLERFMVNFVEKIISVSQTVKNHLINKGYPINKIVIIPNGVCILKHTEKKDLDKFKEKIKYNHNDYIVLMIGNFRKEKDQLTLLKAFNLIRDKYPQLKLVFIGNDNEFSKECKKFTLEEDFNKRVFYLGMLENASRYIKCCDLFVYSTKSETFGIAVIEAILQKKPVLASDIDAMKELSHNGKYFDLFKNGNEIDLANKIENYILKGENFSKILMAYQYAIENYSYEKFIKRLHHLYFT